MHLDMNIEITKVTLEITFISLYKKKYVHGIQKLCIHIELEPKIDPSLHPLELQCVKPQKDPYELYLTPVSIK